MKQNIDEILEDLYQIDDSLRKHEKELKKTIEVLLHSKPDTRFNKAFVEELRSRLSHKKVDNIMSLQSAIFSQFNFKYAAVGLVVVLAIVAVATIYPITREGSGTQKIVSLSSNAFGQFSYSQGEVGAVELLQDATESRVSALVPSIEPGVAGGGVIEPMIYPTLPSREFTSYKYIYKGGDFEIPQDNNLVYRRIRGLQAGGSVTAILSRLNVDLLDINTFNNLDVQNVSFKEAGDGGYAINVNFEEGSVSIYENRRGPINTSAPVEVPSDEDLTAIADKFMKEHRVDTSLYGDPEVLFRPDEIAILSSVDSGMPYYINSISLRYPLRINGISAVDSGGNSFGIEVSINIHTNRVSGMYDLTSQNYESSVYSLTDNKEKIIGSAEAGGGGVPPSKETGKIVEISLGTPEPVLMRFMRFDQGIYEDFYIPALSFPIEDMPKELRFWRQNIVIPLVDGFTQDYGPVILELQMSELEAGVEIIEPPVVE